MKEQQEQKITTTQGKEGPLRNLSNSDKTDIYQGRTAELSKPCLEPLFRSKASVSDAVKNFLPWSTAIQTTEDSRFSAQSSAHWLSRPHSMSPEQAGRNARGLTKEVPAYSQQE